MIRLSHQPLLCLIVMVSLLMFVGSCSAISDRIKSARTPQTRTPKPDPKPTPKPQPTPTKQVQIAELIKEGNDYREAGKYDEAIAAFKKALAIDPKNAEAANGMQETKQERETLIDEHMKLGLQHSAEENLQAAMQEWEKVLELDPQNEKALKYKEDTQKRLDALQ